MRSGELLAILFVFLSILVGGMLLLGWALPSAVAEAPIELHACHAKTCTGLDEAMQRTLGAGETVYLLPSQVGGVSSVAGCSDCAKVHTKSGQSVYVLMRPGTLACVLFGGAHCSATSDAP